MAESESEAQRELVIVTLQFLQDTNYIESARRLEKESGFWFNSKYFEEIILAGEFDEAETYLSAFTKLEDNHYSTQTFFVIRQQKYLEALERQDRAKAVEILYKELGFLSTVNEELYKQHTLLLTLPDFRSNDYFSPYGDTQNARGRVLGQVQSLIKENPLLSDKLIFPAVLPSSRLRYLIDQSAAFQHQFCNCPNPNSVVKTIFTDHMCPKPAAHGEILDSSGCRQITLPNTAGSPTKVVGLLYMNSGVGILALGSDGIQRLWRWVPHEQNPDGKATTSVFPEYWQPETGFRMANDVSGVHLEGATPCIALSGKDSYVVSTVGGMASLFDMMTFKVLGTFMPPPPASTFLALHPQDNNLMAIGTEDSMIHIYNVRENRMVRSKLKGHAERITGLAFSSGLNLLVSSGADAQICFWSIDTWEKKKSVGIEMPAGIAANGDTRVQFDFRETLLLAVHETQLAIFDASEMKCIAQRITQSGPISSAVFACNGQLIYAAFRNGNIGVFDTYRLRLRCLISPFAYLPQGLSPLVVAANPEEHNQFAVGLSDGSFKVIEPAEGEAKWGTDAYNT
ncbi:hypothetical protein AALP_AA8G132300 [Arabis alpina]|uniref:CTLH domain-containing protein n=1 Tax=Arabis alpina TaxID=50452 RepID=A0A087G6R9_ARAAL|nr:hypothetical protein AALP_AA8G132300 [Arabis alpina]